MEPSAVGGLRCEFCYDDIDLRDILSMSVDGEGSVTVGFYIPWPAFERLVNDDCASRRPIRFRARIGDHFTQESLGVLTRVSFAIGQPWGEVTVRPLPQREAVDAPH